MQLCPLSPPRSHQCVLYVCESNRAVETGKMTFLCHKCLNLAARLLAVGRMGEGNMITRIHKMSDLNGSLNRLESETQEPLVDVNHLFSSKITLTENNPLNKNNLNLYFPLIKTYLDSYCTHICKFCMNLHIRISSIVGL